MLPADMLDFQHKTHQEKYPPAKCSVCQVTGQKFLLIVRQKKEVYLNLHENIHHVLRFLLIIKRNCISCSRETT